MHKNASRQALADGIATGARRAGITDAKTITALQSELDGAHWHDFEAEFHPSVGEARQLGTEFVAHTLDHMAGKNTPAKLQKLREAAWAYERGRQRSNKATDDRFLAMDAWAKQYLPKFYARLKNGIGNRPAVVRAVGDRYDKFVAASNGKARDPGELYSARTSKRLAATAAKTPPSYDTAV